MKKHVAVVAGIVIIGVGASAIPLPDRYENEWTFERDPQGSSLHDAQNTGAGVPRAQFDTGFAQTVFTTLLPGAGNVLLCIGVDATPDKSGGWTSGAVLDAQPVTAPAGSVHYLRYDVQYDWDSKQNNGVLGVYFSDGNSGRVGGVVLGRYLSDSFTNAVPAGATATVVPDVLEFAGKLTAIAEVNLAASPTTLKVWYTVDPSTSVDYATPSMVMDIDLDDIDALRFHATGDLRPSGTQEYGAVDNIRHTVDFIAGPSGTAWGQIIEPLTDLAVDPVLTAQISDSLGGGMNLGETNVISVVINNPIVDGRSHPCTQVSSTLTHDGATGAFTVIPDNAPVAVLRGGESVTNTYRVIAHQDGAYRFSARATSEQTTSDPAQLDLIAGRYLTILPVTDQEIVEDSGGIYPGLYEPGETLRIAITTTNASVQQVNHSLNRVDAPSGFTVSALGSQVYGNLNPGDTDVTVYEVVIAPNTPRGTYTFSVVNEGNGLVWTDSFTLPVYVRQPGGDRIKKDNADDLNQQDSWMNGLIPDSTDRAILDESVTTDPLITALGADLAWRGIALVSNTVDWTIGGANNTLTIGEAGIDMANAQADLRFESRVELGTSQTWEVATNRNLTVGGRLLPSGDHRLVKTGDGKLTFPAGRTRELTGDLIVSNGTLAVSGGFIPVDTVRVAAGSAPIGTGPIEFSDGTVLATAGDDGALTNPLFIGEGTLRTNPEHDLLLAGSIRGDGGLHHDGDGVLYLAGTNHFAGGTTVDGGSIIHFTDHKSFGRGRITLRDGAEIRGFLEALANHPTSRTIYNAISLESGMAVIRNAGTAHSHELRFRGAISGPGGLQLQMAAGRRDVHLTSRNTFEGGLEIEGGNSVVFFDSPKSMGRGEIIAKSPNLRIAFSGAGGVIENNINLENGSIGVIPWTGQTLEFSGEIRGDGSLTFNNRRGDVRFSGDNRNWSGGISGLASFAHFNGTKRVVVLHPNGLGTGTITFGDTGGDAQNSRFYVELFVRVPLETRNNLNLIQSGAPRDRNDRIHVDELAIFGSLGGALTHQGVDKIGPGHMVLTAPGTYPSPVNIRSGSLELQAGAGYPGTTTVFPGAVLIADDARMGPVHVQAGGTVEVKGGGLRIEDGPLILEGDTRIVLRPQNPLTAVLTSDQQFDLRLSGVLLIDFSEVNPALNDTVLLLEDWDRLIDDGVKILISGLDDFMTIDHSNLFVDGTVRIVDGGRTSSQEISINVTAGSTQSAYVQVRNPGGETRYFTLKPGTEWPSWLSATPASRTRLNPGAQATVTVTANAAGLPAGTHRFLLPVAWEHGVTDLILVTVRVEGPSLSVAPGALTLPVVENTTGEGTVDLVNTGTLPVSYRVRRVLSEHEIYTQPAADVPWVTVSPTAQTEITSFTSGRSALRAIGFDFPFFDGTETEVSVGIDGTLWFGGKAAIRVFSNQLIYQSGLSRITAKPEADRFIVTWSKLVQPDNAQQTFQAVLHRDGRIDLRYHTIVANSSWQNAQIGLHGPTQWFPAQVPENLQGRTIGFERDAQIARISIPQISGTVDAGANKTVTVMGDATGLSAGDSRTALFVFEYDGGLTRTAGEVAVTMDVLAASATDPVSDELIEDLAPSADEDWHVVLGAPQRTSTGRKITWESFTDDGDGEIQLMDSAEKVYEVQWTTNLFSGWQTLETVTNPVQQVEDKRTMDGPAIFYRVKMIRAGSE